jgi:hypothetical protein
MIFASSRNFTNLKPTKTEVDLTKVSLPGLTFPVKTNDELNFSKIKTKQNKTSTVVLYNVLRLYMLRLPS